MDVDVWETGNVPGLGKEAGEKGGGEEERGRERRGRETRTVIV